MGKVISTNISEIRGIQKHNVGKVKLVEGEADAGV